MEDLQKLVACAQCDLLMTLPERIHEVDKLGCSRCGHVLRAHPHRFKERAAALSISALILLVWSLVFPLLSFQAKGHSSTITLLSVFDQLLQYDYFLLAMLVATFMVVLPAALLFSVLVLAASNWLALGDRQRKMLAKIIQLSMPWAMADVFVIGVFVSIIKIIAMAEVQFGPAFWSFLLFTMIFAYLTAKINPHLLWRSFDHEHS